MFFREHFVVRKHDHPLWEHNGEMFRWVVGWGGSIDHSLVLWHRTIVFVS